MTPGNGVMTDCYDARASLAALLQPAFKHAQPIFWSKSRPARPAAIVARECFQAGDGDHPSLRTMHIERVRAGSVC